MCITVSANAWKTVGGLFKHMSTNVCHELVLIGRRVLTPRTVDIYCCLCLSGWCHWLDDFSNFRKGIRCWRWQLHIWLLVSLSILNWSLLPLSQRGTHCVAHKMSSQIFFLSEPSLTVVNVAGEECWRWHWQRRNRWYLCCIWNYMHGLYWLGI